MSVPSFCEVNFLVHSVSLVSIGSAQGWVNSARIKAVFDHEQLRYVNLSIKRIWTKEWDLFESVRVQLGLLAYGFNKRLCLYRWVCRWRNLSIFVLLFQIIETPLDWFMWRWSYGKKKRSRQCDYIGTVLILAVLTFYVFYLHAKTFTVGPTRFTWAGASAWLLKYFIFRSVAYD